MEHRRKNLINLAVFSCPKSFENEHIARIQRNAIQSWLRLEPRPEIILFGDEPGVREICDEFRVSNGGPIALSRFGTPLFSELFKSAQREARSPILVYANADIVLFPELLSAISLTARRFKRFLLTGARTDLDVRQSIDFDSPTWAEEWRSRALANGQLMIQGIDYLAFPRGQYTDIPPFAIGRPGYDNWLLWKTRRARIPVINASEEVIAVHQSHRRDSEWASLSESPEFAANRSLVGSWKGSYILRDATYKLRGQKFVSNRGDWLRNRMLTANQLANAKVRNLLRPLIGPLRRRLRELSRQD